MESLDRRTFLQSAASGAAALAIQPQLDAWALGPGDRPPLGVGVVGLGRQGRAILAELQKIEAVRIVAVCDVLDGRLRSGARRAGRDAKTFADHRQMLDRAEALDAVLVTTPTDTHRPIAADALAAGKHVYCEAPLAADESEARALARAARGADRVFQVGLLARSNPIYRLAHSFYRAGASETLLAARAQDHDRTSWRFPADDAVVARALDWRLDPGRAAGLPGELGTHQFDVVDWFVGSYPTAVRGRGAIRRYGDGRSVPDTVHCQLRYADGVELAWSGTLGSSYEGRHEVLTGSMATFRLAWNAGWLFKEADADQGITLIADATKLARQGKLEAGIGLPNPPLYYALVDFVRSVREGTEVVATAAEGFRATVVGLAAERAVRSGGDEVEIAARDLQLDPEDG